ncbi:AraC family transcriptional regulator [Ruminiclostridium cellulolyticum]|uniref:Transcriptional regulator, AraC family n=1 Tax=Ruminiclostridium cellulolyticum (strain ATCC 35319 / DSM 5812 / JCM 6584 / H10) TaxID=394503 RepID=B8I274_RUMCH|nr:AraC family transcriptional regulator [Ruminiclostridium cellulolyticum]ACL75900.1 transcriptional regulator, AraC family [Ruminiclostridium cellulolyticum H10]
MIPFYENRVEDLLVFRENSLDFLPHLHAQLELLYVEDGEIEITVNGCTRLLKKGDLSVSFPNSVHSYNTPPHQERMNCIVVILNLILAGDFINTLLKFHPKVPFISSDNLHKDVPYAINTLYEEYNYAQSKPVYTPICKAYIQIIISRLLQQMELITNTDVNYFDIIFDIINYINENYMQPISLNDMSRALGVGKHYLSRVFSDKIKISFSDYINGIRVSWACNMLLNTNKNITQIAYDCGFQSIRTFNRAFHKACHVSPSKFRKSQVAALPREID